MLLVYKCRTQLHIRLEAGENKQWQFAYQGAKQHFITAVLLELKTHFMITRAFTISIIASSKDLWTSFLVMAGHSTRSVTSNVTD